jgi:RimJ/RimL family protein N-acetyltransferase
MENFAKFRQSELLKILHTKLDSAEPSGIILRPLLPADFNNLFDAASDPAIWVQHPDSSRSGPEGFGRFFNQAFQQRHATFVVLQKENHEVMGSSRFYFKDESDPRIFIGYTFLARKFWGGYWNRILKTTMLKHAFRHCNEVYFEAAETNNRSLAALTKLGAEKLPHPESGKVLFRITSVWLNNAENKY